MALDITTLTDAGILPFIAEWVDFPTNTRNAFTYKIKFEYYTYSDVTRNLVARFAVQKFAMYNGELELDDTYVYDSIANDTTLVDKYGNYVNAEIDSVDVEGNPIKIANPDVWGTEFERMSIIFSAPLSDTDILNGYLLELFDKGMFDKRKR